MTCTAGRRFLLTTTFAALKRVGLRVAKRRFHRLRFGGSPTHPVEEFALWLSQEPP